MKLEDIKNKTKDAVDYLVQLITERLLRIEDIFVPELLST
jgi:hypothetical protein